MLRSCSCRSAGGLVLTTATPLYIMPRRSQAYACALVRWRDMHACRTATRQQMHGLTTCTTYMLQLEAERVAWSGPVRSVKKKKLIPTGRKNTKGRHVIRPVLLPGSRTGHGREKARAWKSTPTPPWPMARISQGQPSRSHTNHNQRHGDIYRRLSTETRRHL